MAQISTKITRASGSVLDGTQHRKRIARYQGTGAASSSAPLQSTLSPTTLTAAPTNPPAPQPVLPEPAPATARTTGDYPLPDGPVRKYTAIIRARVADEAAQQEESDDHTAKSC